MAKVAVLKVAREGYDVKTANPKNLTIDSSKNQLKLYARVSVTTDDPI